MFIALTPEMFIALTPEMFIALAPAGPRILNPRSEQIRFFLEFNSRLLRRVVHSGKRHFEGSNLRRKIGKISNKNWMHLHPNRQVGQLRQPVILGRHGLRRAMGRPREDAP